MIPFWIDVLRMYMCCLSLIIHIDMYLYLDTVRGVFVIGIISTALALLICIIGMIEIAIRDTAPSPVALP